MRCWVAELGAKMHQGTDKVGQWVSACEHICTRAESLAMQSVRQVDGDCEECDDEVSVCSLCDEGDDELANEPDID